MDDSQPLQHRSPTELALPLGSEADLDPLLERIGDAHYVLLGEASHGTHEFYSWRAAITKRLIAEKGFSFVGVEGDWPDCYRVNASVVAMPGAPTDPRDALLQFERWPTWMWANEDVVDFTRWLRHHNEQLATDERVGFYGLDVYSLWDSLRGVVNYLREHEPDHVEAAFEAFQCFEPYAEDPQAYAQATWLVPESCEDAVVGLLRDVREVTDVVGPETDQQFNAEQNALVAAGAEAYYRAMVRGGPESWNVRDRHMATTLDRLMAHHESRKARKDAPVKAVVWEHNTHVGDARFTTMSAGGMVNVGELVRELHGPDDVVLAGFASHRGSVIAGSSWGASAQEMPVPPAREGSVEALIHDDVDDPAALFVFPGGDVADRPDQLPPWLSERMPHRAIGVVYRPEAEQRGNYVPSVVGQRYDALLWFDRTTALVPLHGTHPRGGEAETWPSGT